MIDQIIAKLYHKHDLTSSETTYIMNEIMEGKVDDIKLTAFLSGLYFKGETIDEITSSIKVVKEKATTIDYNEDLLDIVGTGGDNIASINVSTIAMFIIAANNIKVAKHGNRSVSSACGSADLLEALGVNINLNKDEAKCLLDKINLTFLYAINYHSSMRHASKVRKALKVRTIFNLIGPLSNPANANHIILGVYQHQLVYPLACVLKQLNIKRALVVSSQDGMDEISISAPTHICEVKDNQIYSYLITPQQFGLNDYQLKDIVAGNKELNASIALALLNGQKSAYRDIVALNAAFGLYLFKDDLTIHQCLNLAYETIDNKKALNKLNEIIKYSNEVPL
ncbi:MAG: anthranilate phosphoribosyltransferase [Bacilli bacterium]